MKTPFYGLDGRLLGLIGVARDITERRRAEAGLRESEQRLATIVAYTPEALEAFQARPARFDLVVTDQLMPRMSGTELATRLREIRPDIPVRHRAKGPRSCTR